MYFCLVALLLLFTLNGCDQPKPVAHKTIVPLSKSIVQDTITPVFGYRFIVTGDFNGDGTMDTLQEHYVDCDGKELHKFPNPNTDHFGNYELAMPYEPVAFASATRLGMDTIHAGGFSLGFIYLRNEGDLDGNGTDEVAYVNYGVDMSSMSTCYILTHTKHGWETMYSFGIWEWQIPSLPFASSAYGLFGSEGLQTYDQDDTLNAQLERDLQAFTFIKKEKNGYITVTMRTDEENDSIGFAEKVRAQVRLKDQKVLKMEYAY